MRGERDRKRRQSANARGARAGESDENTDRFLMGDFILICVFSSRLRTKEH